MRSPIILIIFDVVRIKRMTSFRVTSEYFSINVLVVYHYIANVSDSQIVVCRLAIRISGFCVCDKSSRSSKNCHKFHGKFHFRALGSDGRITGFPLSRECRWMRSCRRFHQLPFALSIHQPRPFGCGTGLPNSSAVAIYNSIACNTFTNALACDSPCAMQPGNSGASAINNWSASLQ